MSAHLCLVVSAVGFHCCRQIQAGQREVRSSDARGPEVSRRSWPGFFGGFDEAIRPVYVERGGRSIEHPSARTPSDSLDDDSGRFSGVSGCGAHPLSSRQSDERLSPLNYPVRWISTPSIDLDTPSGTFVRAVAESYFVSDFHLGREGFFPGFARATGEVMPWQDLSPLVRDHAPQVVYMWVESPRLPLRDDEDQPLSLSPGDTAVVVCLSTSWVGPWGRFLRSSIAKRANPRLRVKQVVLLGRLGMSMEIGRLFTDCRG